MLLERNQAVIGAIAAAVLVAGTFFAVVLSGGLITRGTELEAVFTDAAGLAPRSFVFVAGVRSGEVQSVEIDGDKVRATFTLTAPGIPDDSTASIILQNTLGKRAIRIQPGVSNTFFEKGDVIPVERTSTPIDLPELGDESARLLGEVDANAMSDIANSLADITEGQREEVADLLDGISRLSQVLDENKDELETVLKEAETFIDAAADQDQELVRIIDNFGSTLDVLVRRRSDITELLTETARATNLTADLVEENRTQLDRSLFELHESLEIVDAHQVDLAHILAYAGVSVRGFSSIGYCCGEAQEDQPHWGNVFVTDLGAAGIEALLACDGSLDQLFTELIGPSSKCEGNNEGDPPSEEASAASVTTVTYSPVDAFFSTHIHGGAS
ncbi:MAG: MCE family protein [Nitriliruptorales bacterium]|nr:MCE family protein [Nitriliruptorales bacterium]